MKIDTLKFDSKKQLTLNEYLMALSVIVSALTMLILLAKDELNAYLAHKHSLELAAQLKKILHENPRGSEKFFNHLLEWTHAHNFTLLIKLEKLVSDSMMNSGTILPEDVEDFDSPDIRLDAKRKLMTFSAEVQDLDEKKFINGLLDVIGNY